MNDSRANKSEFSKPKLNKVALEIKKSSGTHSLKLNIYKLILKSEKNSIPPTFNDLFKSKFNPREENKDKLFDLYFQNIVQFFGKENFKEDKKNKKIICNADPVKLNKNRNCYIIDGVIKGGKYGIRRELADTKDKTKENTLIHQDHAVLDSYYLLIYTPLNSGIGFLLIQSYTEESITNSIKDFVTSFFSHDFYKIKIEPYLSQKFIEKYIESSTISEFGVTIPDISQIIRDKELLKEETLEVEIKIKPKSKIPSKSLLDDRSLITKCFKDLIATIVGVNSIKKEAYLTDDNKQKAYAFYDETKQKNRINIIEPTIYLEDEEIICDKDTGMPDFKEIRNYCISVLQEIKEETEKEFKEITPDDL